MDGSSDRLPPSTVRREYRFLHKYLRDRFAHTVVLTFTQIEDLLGSPLPAEAALAASWWTDERAGEVSPMSEAWLTAQRTAVPNLLARTVRFERVSG
jgi:hypothetical protein